MITSQTNRSFIEAEVYSDFILHNLHDGLLPGNFYRDVSDFNHGETLHIKTLGEATIQYVEEDKPVTYTPIESGEVTMKIDQYVGDAWYITDVMRQDGSQIEALKSARAKEATRALQEYYETKALETLHNAAADVKSQKINGFSHYGVAAGDGATVTTADFNAMKLAFDKAQVPYGGRVCIVDPVVGATLNSLFNTSYDVNRNPEFMSLLQEGFDRDHQYVLNLFGWHIISSNRLPLLPAITTSDKLLNGDAATAVSGDSVPCIFMNIADDQHKALMSAWRQMPKVSGQYNQDMARDEYVTRARFGFGIQRYDTLGCLIVNASNY